MIAKMPTARNNIAKTMKNQDPRLISTSFLHRFRGETTALEWIPVSDMLILRHPQVEINDGRLNTCFSIYRHLLIVKRIILVYK